MTLTIQLKGRNLPRNTQGDPDFTLLSDVLGVFTEAEVVTLVNRALYQLEYQHNAHKTRAQRLRDRERPLKLLVRRMFNVPWSKATDTQIQQAAQRLIDDFEKAERERNKK